MKTKYYIPILICFFSLFVCTKACYAQAFGTCEHGEAVAFLDVNNVRAAFSTTGSLFHTKRGYYSFERYLVPKKDSISAIFQASVSIAGRIGNEIYLAGRTLNYYQEQFWPGPLDEYGRPPDDCSDYDRIFSIYRDSLLVYEKTGIASRDLIDWPFELGAPVIDGDGIPDNYNLSGGDRPALLGDQMLWWVMNDAGNQKTWRTDSSPPIPLELQVTAFAYDDIPDYPFWRGIIRHSTFYRFKLIYKGISPLEEAWFGIWVDVELGNDSDNFVGSDSLLGLGYMYNGDDNDGGDHGYGDRPPALGFDFLRGPVVLPDGLDNDDDEEIDERDERAGTTRFIRHFHDGSDGGNPDMVEEYYNYLRGLWKNGRPFTKGGNGWAGSFPIHFLYSGNPPDYWSEEKTCNEDFICRNTPSGRHFLISTGPFRMEPGDEQEIILGIIWSRGKDRLDSVYKLKQEDAVIQALTDLLFEPRLPVVETEEIPKRYTLVHNYPNPFAGTTTFTYDLPADDTVLLRVYDVLGRVVETLVDAPQPAGRYQVDFDGSGLPAGVYFYRYTTSRVDGAHKLVVMR